MLMPSSWISALRRLVSFPTNGFPLIVELMLHVIVHGDAFIPRRTCYRRLDVETQDRFFGGAGGP
jgi:hypothetical protein